MVLYLKRMLYIISTLMALPFAYLLHYYKIPVRFALVFWLMLDCFGQDFGTFLLMLTVAVMSKK